MSGTGRRRTRTIVAVRRKSSRALNAEPPRRPRTVSPYRKTAAPWRVSSPREQRLVMRDPVAPGIRAPRPRRRSARPRWPPGGSSSSGVKNAPDVPIDGCGRTTAPAASSRPLGNLTTQHGVDGVSGRGDPAVDPAQQRMEKPCPPRRPAAASGTRLDQGRVTARCGPWVWSEPAALCGFGTGFEAAGGTEALHDRGDLSPDGAIGEAEALSSCFVGEAGAEQTQ